MVSLLILQVNGIFHYFIIPRIIKLKDTMKFNIIIKSFFPPCPFGRGKKKSISTHFRSRKWRQRPGTEVRSGVIHHRAAILERNRNRWKRGGGGILRWQRARALNLRSVNLTSIVAHITYPAYGFVIHL